MNRISQYFEKVAEKYLKHSETECHFSDATAFATKVPRLMHYPCMGIDVQGFAITGMNGQEFISVQMNLYLLSHIRDTGRFEDLQKAFNENYLLALKIIKDMKEVDYTSDNTNPATFFDFNSVEGTRIEFKDAALYGYAIGITFNLPFDYVTCKL